MWKAESQSSWLCFYCRGHSTGCTLRRRKPSVWLALFPSSQMGYFLCSEEYICVDVTICPFHSVEKMLTCTSCHNSWLDPKVCYFKPSHLVMYCSPSRRYSADAVSAKKESCVLGSSPSAKSSMLSSSCAVSEDYKVKNEAWLICIS